MPAPEDIGHMRLGRAVNALPAWTFDMLRSHVDELCAVLWWSGFALCLTLGRSGGPNPPDGVVSSSSRRSSAERRCTC